MINKLLELLQLNDYYGDSKVIDLAKGYHKIPKSYKEVYKQFKRELKWQ